MAKRTPAKPDSFLKGEDDTRSKTPDEAPVPDEAPAPEEAVTVPTKEPTPMKSRLQHTLKADEDTSDKERLLIIDELLRRSGDQPVLSSGLRRKLWDRGLLPERPDLEGDDG